MFRPDLVARLQSVGARAETGAAQAFKRHAMRARPPSTTHRRPSIPLRVQDAPRLTAGVGGAPAPAAVWAPSDEVRDHPPDAQSSLQSAGDRGVATMATAAGGGIQRVRFHRPSGAHPALAGRRRPRFAGSHFISHGVCRRPPATTLRLIPNIVVLPYRIRSWWPNPVRRWTCCPVAGSRSRSVSDT